MIYYIIIINILIGGLTMAEYTREEIIKKLQDSSKDMSTLYTQTFINYTGKTTDTKEKYTEVIAEWLIKNFNLFDNIKKITRQSSYKVDTHDGKHNNQNSNRLEEIMAIEIFNQKSLNILGKVLDYQTR